jgi:ATP-dependent DNA helicase RecG
MEKARVGFAFCPVANGSAGLGLAMGQCFGYKETILAEVLERVEKNWGTFNETERKIIDYLFGRQEATIRELVDGIGVSEQTVRNNLRKLESLVILERRSHKTRDPKALYGFVSG